jgi:hypothetical protein
VPSLVPIRDQDGRIIVASLRQVNLALLRDLVAAG